MKPKWQKQASLAQEICTVKFHFFGAVFAFKGYPFKNIFAITLNQHLIVHVVLHIHVTLIVMQ